MKKSLWHVSRGILAMIMAAEFAKGLPFEHAARGCCKGPARL